MYNLYFILVLHVCNGFAGVFLEVYLCKISRIQARIGPVH